MPGDPLDETPTERLPAERLPFFAPTGGHGITTRKAPATLEEFFALPDFRGRRVHEYRVTLYTDHDGRCCFWISPFARDGYGYDFCVEGTRVTRVMY